ncbi:MAG: AAA family ATPase [Oscillospiraceae bacterium]|nr:AAA family ATPase [Oscillospiraceae bacterium]
MYISKLIVKNYKLLKDVNLDLNERINIFVGENDSGKSTILEVLSIITSGRLNGYAFERQIKANMFNDEARKKYINSLATGMPVSPPEIIIEAFLQDADHRFSGTNNSLLEDAYIVYHRIYQVCRHNSRFSQVRSVPLEELIKLDSYPIRELVGRLLKDKTTRKNILFASDSYAGYGAGYRDDSQMTEGVLLGFDSCDIQPRVYKAASEQTERTRKRAEVFTPAWIVNQMNNHCDAEWFGRANVFNHPDGQEWTVSTEPITFPEGKDWKQYVDSRRLEITCGEAPYIVPRYDTATGEIIPIERRIGILDRKLRIVNENAADESEWFKWAFRAFQSVYGYEYQGDNLLIARINLLYTLADYIEAQWHRQATQKELEKFLNVICWNFWQMDGMPIPNSTSAVSG